MRLQNIAIYACLLMLCGCGFTPMYGSKAISEQVKVQSRLNDIAIGVIPDRVGQYLRNRLIDRFYSDGTPQSPSFRLTMTAINETKTDLDITKNANATRAELKLKTTMVLRDESTGIALLTRDLVSSTSYNILSSLFTTRVSEDNARLNALDDLSRQIEQQIILYFERQGKT